ncbi:MAG TPA: tetratricopeptide repeat protein [Blastocatellia bacterium]|nr:tetratricopeptide repeat protein [Blastocatellia bacterium]
MHSYHLTCRSFRLVLLCLLALTCLFVQACKEDPEKAKLKHLTKGKQYLQEKKYNEARIEFRNALLLDKKSAEASYGLAEAALGLNNVQEAFDLLTATIGLDPKNLEAKTKLGNIYLQFVRDASNVTEAERLAREVLEADANNIEGYILRASVRTAQQKWADAEQDLKRALELNPKRIESHLSYAKFWQERARGATEKTTFLAEAEKNFKQAIGLDAKSSLAHLAFADFLFSNQRMEEAEAQLKQAVEADGTDRIALAAIARFYESRKNFGEAEKYLSKLAEVNPDKNAGRAQLIDLHARDGKVDQAINEYQELIKQSPKYIQAYVQLAGLLMGKGDLTGAQQQIDAALKVDKQNTDALLMRGRLNIANGKLRDAIADLEQVLKNEPRHAMGLYFMADARVRDGDPERARSDVNELLKYYPDSPAGLLMKIRVLLSQTRPTSTEGSSTMKNEINEAVKTADRIITGINFLRTNAVALQASRLEPESLPALESQGYAARGVAKAQLMDIAGAMADLERAIQIDPRNAEARGNLINVLLSKSDLARARQIADQTVELRPLVEPAITSIVNVYLAQKDYATALQRLDGLIASQAARKAFLLDQKVAVYSAQGDTTNTAMMLQQVKEADPKYLDAYFKNFAFYKTQNKPDQAINELQQVVNLRPDNPRQLAQAHLLLGMMEEEQGRYEEAIKNYERAIALDSRTPVASIAFNNLAWVIADKGKGNLDKAAEHARKAIQISPGIASYYDTLGYVLHKKGLNSVAIEQYRKAIERRPNDPTFQRHIAKSYQESGDRAKALQAYEQALKLGGSNYRDAEVVKGEIAKLR